MIRLIAVTALLSGCIPRPITSKQWLDCVKTCFPAMVVEACNAPFTGPGCLCSNDDHKFLDKEYENVPHEK